MVRKHCDVASLAAALALTPFFATDVWKKKETILSFGTQLMLAGEHLQVFWHD